MKMEQANLGNFPDKSGAKLDQENNRSFTTRLPYKVIHYFSTKFLPQPHGPINKLTDKQRLLLELGNKFHAAGDNHMKGFGRYKKGPIDLNYAEIEALGKPELTGWIVGYAFVRISSEDPEFDELLGKFGRILEELMDNNNYPELGRLLRRFVFPAGLAPKYSEFSENFLKLNSAFVQAGGKDNSDLTGLFADVIKNYKTQKPQFFFSPNKSAIEDEISTHKKYI